MDLEFSPAARCGGVEAAHRNDTHVIAEDKTYFSEPLKEPISSTRLLVQGTMKLTTQHDTSINCIQKRTSCIAASTTV